MTLKDFKPDQNNHFVAMEYYWLILNRTFLILLTNEYLIGIKGNGVISVEGTPDNFWSGINYSKPFLDKLTVKGDLNNPYSYLKMKHFKNMLDMDLLGDDFLRLNGSNFRINRKDIKNVYHDAKKKWGMGYYPHDGKVYIETNDDKKKELIILGNQSGMNIANLISKKLIDNKQNWIE